MSQQLPPANLSFLISTLATQALVALGQIPNPVTEKVEKQLDHAQHFIDTLSMLEAKTASHRDEQESRLLEKVLHDLRLIYVQASK